MRRPSVEFQPHASKYLLRGIDMLADIVRPTLGPRPRYVALERITRGKTPEVLSDAGTLARRLIEFADGRSDMGAMLLRQALCSVNDRVGDGTATTAVLAQAMVHEAYRSVAAGANAMRVRDGIRLAATAAVNELQAQAKPVAGQKELTQIAQSYCHDVELARMLGEMFSIIGTGGYVEVQSANVRYLEREYVEGAYYRSTGWVSSAFADLAMRRAELQDAAIMLVDGRINDVAALAKAIGSIMAAGHTSIAIICRGMSEVIISVLAHNHKQGTFKCLPITAPASSTDRKSMFDDLAVMTGGTVLAGGDDADLSFFSADMIGKARRIWSDSQQFGFVAGKGSPKAVRAHIITLRNRMAQATEKNEILALRRRLGQLMGGTALLSVGALTDAEQKLRQDIAERSVHYMHSVAEAGMVAGGGASLLACQETVRAINAEDADVAAGISAVARALEEPMRAIASNAGFPESTSVARAKQYGAGFGINVLNGETVDMRAAGIIDSADVLAQALLAAASVASMTLTTDILVLHRKPKLSTNP